MNEKETCLFMKDIKEKKIGQFPTSTPSPSMTPKYREGKKEKEKRGFTGCFTQIKAPGEGWTPVTHTPCVRV